MKKLSIATLLIVFFCGITFAVQAANTVSCHTTSEAIQKFGVEKAGSPSFTFDPGSVLTAGDWWYADLPVGVFVGKPIDYEIVYGAPATPFPTLVVPDGGTTAFGTCVQIRDVGTV